MVEEVKSDDAAPKDQPVEVMDSPEEKGGGAGGVT
jgi:hypothetical protein